MIVYVHIWSYSEFDENKNKNKFIALPPSSWVKDFSYWNLIMHDLPVIGGLMFHLHSHLWIKAKYENKSFLRISWMVLLNLLSKLDPPMIIINT